MKSRKVFLTYSLALSIIACQNSVKSKSYSSENIGKKDVEILNKSSSKSDIKSLKTQNKSTSNVNSKEKGFGKIANPKFPLNQIFGIWAIDPDGPHADFQLDSTSYFIVDSEENGNRRYVLKGDSLVVYHPDFKIAYRILKADGDSLILQSEFGKIRNVRWKN